MKQGNHNKPRRWETPEEARGRLEFRLSMVTRRLDVANAAAAAVAAAMRTSTPGIHRVVESWTTAAGKAARSAGIAALHGKPLKPEEAEEGGRPGVTWSSHPQFRKYFTLLRLGIPREEVVATAVRNGVDPFILDHGDEEIPLSTEYSVVSPCAPLLRISPDLDSTPVAQLSSSSGTIYTADPLKAFGPCPTSPPAAAATTTTNGTNEETCGGTGEGPNGKPSSASPADENPPAESCMSAEEETALIDGNSDGVVLGRAEDMAVADNSSDSDYHRVVEAVDSEGGAEQGQMPMKNQYPSQHPLVLSGRRVWVISPVVGWASVWAETRQSILTPAGIEDSDDGKGSVEKGVAVGWESASMKPSSMFAAPGGDGDAASKDLMLLLIGAGGGAEDGSETQGAAGNKEGESVEGPGWGQKNNGDNKYAVFVKGKTDQKMVGETGPSIYADAGCGKMAAAADAATTMTPKAVPAAVVVGGTEVGSNKKTDTLTAPSWLSTPPPPPPPPLPALLSLSLDDSVASPSSPSAAEAEVMPAVADSSLVPGPLHYPSQLNKADALKFLTSISPDMPPLGVPPPPPPSSVPGAAFGPPKAPSSSSSVVLPPAVWLSPPSTPATDLSTNGGPATAGLISVDPAIPAPGVGDGGVSLVAGGGSGAEAAALSSSSAGSSSTGSSSSSGSSPSSGPSSTGSSSSPASPLPLVGLASDSSCASSPLPPPPSSIVGGAISSSEGFQSSGGGGGGGGAGGGGQQGVSLTFEVGGSGVIDFDEEAKKTE